MVAANVTNTYVVPAGTKVSPYYDDFDESKNFHRILFRPGYPVQARELTQLQTILQNQVERFGRHIFTNGSPVIGGDVFIPEDNHAAIKLQNTYGVNNSDIVASSFKGKTIVLGPTQDTSVKFKVLATTEATDTDPPTLYGNYVSSNFFADSDTIKVLDENIYANIAISDHRSIGKLAFLRDSIFFFNGYFIKVPSQVEVIGKYTSRPSVKVGLQMEDDIVTESMDMSLLDPALSSSNYQAPGASRYQLHLSLSSRELDSTDDSKFIELARVEAGKLTRLVKFPIYSEIEEVLARRTYDESGNYTVRPFVVRFDTNQRYADDYFDAILSPGKAYIRGYEFETIAEQRVAIPKARTTNSVVDGSIALNYGNYVIVDGLKGDFDYTSTALFDIHCVPFTDINFYSNTTYQRTKIGTGHVNDIEYLGGDVTDTLKRLYEFYIYDTNFRSITCNAYTVTANSVTIFNNNGVFCDVSNSYDGSTLIVVSGKGKGQSYVVESYDGISNTFILSTDFVEQPDANSVLSVNYDFSVAETFVINDHYTPGATSNANCNISNLNKLGNVSSGYAFVSEPSLAKLIFKLPEDYISANISNVEYTYTRKISDITFTAGISAPAPIGPSETFVGSGTSNVSSGVLENYIVVCKNKKSSARSNGDILKVTAEITDGSPDTVIFNTSNTATNDTFIADVYATVRFSSGVLPKQKTFVQSNTITMSTETSTNLTGWNTGSYANVFINAGQVLITNPSKKVGVSETLYISDVIGISKIYDLNGAAVPEPGASLSDYMDVTNRFDFDNGQRETHYDHASISLKPNWPVCQGPLLICCYYYTQTTLSNEGKYFNVDSYPSLNEDVINEGQSIGTGYSIIPLLKKTNGDLLEVRDCIDFRPARTNASNASPNYTSIGYGAPQPTSNFLLDYQYYLGRRDLLALTPKRNFDLIMGVPDVNPKEPTIPNKSMVLYALTVLPYTRNISDIKIKYIDNKRYTMRDIGKIDKRVENLEYYVSLNLLEKKAVDMSITDVNGLTRPKYGIFADSFTGHALGNSDLVDYRCAMDLDKGILQPESTTTGIWLKANNSTSTGVTFHSDRVTLNYNEVVLEEQPFATKSAPVAEFLFAVFDGNIITLPEADIWKSTNVDPTIIVTDTDTVEYTRINVYQSIVNSQTRI